MATVAVATGAAPAAGAMEAGMQAAGDTSSSDFVGESGGQFGESGGCVAAGAGARTARFLTAFDAAFLTSEMSTERPLAWSDGRRAS